jgi:hypothetical protein
VEYRREGVSISDVGRVTPEGNFDFFFNIYLSADHPINANVPDGFVPLSSYDPIDVGHSDFAPGNYVASSSIHEINGDFSEYVLRISAELKVLKLLCIGPRLVESFCSIVKDRTVPFWPSPTALTWRSSKISQAYDSMQRNMPKVGINMSMKPEDVGW